MILIMLCMRDVKQLTGCWHRRWRGLNPDFDSAVKRIKCSTAYHVECVERELYALLAADGRPHCIGTTGCYWEPWNRKDGTRLGTKWYLAMPCVPCLSGPVALREIQAGHG